MLGDVPAPESRVRRDGNAPPVTGLEGPSLCAETRVFGRVPVLLHHLSANCDVMQVSDRWLRAFHYERSEVIGKPISEFMTSESGDYANRRLAQLAAAGDCEDVPFDFITGHGEVVAMTVAISAERDETGAMVGILFVAVEHKQREPVDTPRVEPLVDDELEQRLFDEREFNVAILDKVADALIRVDANGKVELINPAAERMLSVTNAQAHLQPLSQLLPLFDPLTDEPLDPLARVASDERPWVSNTTNIQLPDRELNAEIRTSALNGRDGKLNGYVIVLSDVSEAHKLRDAICFQAIHDNLTGLYNRHEFSRRLKQLIEQIHDEQDRHVLCYIDIDQFRLINDTCGHAAGDELLKQFAELLSHGVRGDDTLARIGNDQFALLLRGCSTFHAQRRTRALLDRLSAFRFQWEAKRFRITVSIGLVPIDVRSRSAESALRAADSACVSARAAGRNRFVVFDAQDDRYCRHYGDLKWMRRVEAALEEDRFVLHAQPIRALNDNSAPDNFEILLRMVDRDGNDVAPGRFLPAVERFNLSAAVDRWVVKNALAAIRATEEASPDSRFWTINLSGQSLSDRLFQDYLFAELAKNETPPGKVCFEITETAAIAEMDRAIEFMNALRERGCALALDDFGSGLSSYAYLKNLPVDIVKIDGQFVRDIAHSEVAQAMVRSINEIAQLMGKRTVAEYVEDEEILQRLHGVGVDYVQGYGIGRPKPMSEALQG
ncbi:MAG: EAL domain-containing protein [Gammaproteobacteria bacterium]